MPVIVKDFTWRQSKTAVTVNVPLHGVPVSKVDLLATSSYVKASFSNFIFEVFPLHQIVASVSRCTKMQHEIVFELIKLEAAWWERLEIGLTNKEKQELKTRLLDEHYKKSLERAEVVRNRKAQLKKEAVNETIRIDGIEKRKLEESKLKGKREALECIEELHEPETISKDVEVVSLLPPPIPLPRNVHVVHVDFTKREFPTPLRESHSEEEREWSRRQAAARRTALGFVGEEDLRPEERNPQFLHAKGREFMKNDNLLGALSAYSFGIEIAPKFADLYIARSEAHYRQGNYCRTAEDCTTALELLKPECLANVKERFECIGRRGKALYKLGYLRQAANELAAALRLKPHDEELLILIDETLNRLRDRTE